VPSALSGRCRVRASSERAAFAAIHARERLRALGFRLAYGGLPDLPPGGVAVGELVLAGDGHGDAVGSPPPPQRSRRMPNCATNDKDCYFFNVASKTASGFTIRFRQGSDGSLVSMSPNSVTVYYFAIINK
jgi:hypothetical protein